MALFLNQVTKIAFDMDIKRNITVDKYLVSVSVYNVVTLLGSGMSLGTRVYVQPKVSMNPYLSNPCNIPSKGISFEFSIVDLLIVNTFSGIQSL